MTKTEPSPPDRPGTGRRLASRAIDLLLAGLASIAIAVVALLSLLAGLQCAGSWVVACGVSTVAAILAVVLFVIAIAFPLVYEVFFLRFWGRTPGKALLGLAVARGDGTPVTLVDALQRACVIWLPLMLSVVPALTEGGPESFAAVVLLLGIAYQIGLTVTVVRGSALSDRVAGTRVLRGAPPPRPDDDTPAPVRQVAIGAAALAGLLIVLYVFKPFGEGDSGKLQVLTTSALLADMVEQVGGDRIEVSHAFRSADEGHRVDPTRSQRNAVRDADVVIAIGTYDADFTIRTGAEPYLVERSKSNPSLRIEDIKSAYERRYPDRILFAARDLHTWLSIPNARTMVAIIRDALVAEDPNNAGVYVANAARYLAILDSTDSYIREQVARVPERCRTIVTDREFLTYYADAYSLTTVGPAVSPFGNQPEAQADSDEMVALIRRSPVKTIFVHQGRTADVTRVSGPAAADVVELYADELGGSGSGAESYIEMMRTNTDLIVEALRVC